MITIGTIKGREYTTADNGRTLAEMLADELDARGIKDKSDRVAGFWRDGRYYEVEA